MEKITKENIHLQYPNLINYDLLKEKGLGDTEPNERYFKLLNNYKSMFEAYLCMTLELDTIDKRIKESELKFIPIKEENMDFYQISSTMNLNYLYLRNDLHIEKLSVEDLNYLENKDSLDEESTKFIVRTFKNVINPYEETKRIFYGPENENYISECTDLVIGVRYDEIDKSIPEDKFVENFSKQMEYITELKTVISILGTMRLDVFTNCIHYNEMSIIQNYEKLK